LLRAFLVANWFDYNPGHRVDYEPGCMYLYLGLPALFAIAWAIRRHTIRPYLQPMLALAVALLLANPPMWLLHAVEHAPALASTMQPYNFYAAVGPMMALVTAHTLEDFFRRRGPAAMPPWAVTVSAAVLGAWSLRQLWIWRRGGMFAAGRAAAVETAIALAL